MKKAGKRMSQIRISKGLTAVEVSKDLNISVSSYNKYEQGIRCPREKNRKKIADYYGLSEASLFYAY